MSTRKVIAIVVLTNLIVIGLLLAYLSTAGVVMAFPPGPEGQVPPEEAMDGSGVINTKKATIKDPNYDSGWIKASKGKNTKIKHNLLGNVEDYLVNVICKDTSKKGDGINHNWYGSTPFKGGMAWWGLTRKVIYIWRDYNDPYCERVRVRIWKTGA